MSAPTLNGLLYTVRGDIPDTKIRKGDLVCADPKPGWTTPGIYILIIDWEKDKPSIVAVGRCDPFTKRGKVRKRINIEGFCIVPGDNSRVHRVMYWYRPV